MLKKDPIFWCAAGIFILALLLMAITQEQLWLTLMIGSYLLRPTLASLGVARRYVDERQMSLHYRSGNIGFIVMIIMCVIFAVKLSAEGNHDWEIFNLIIVAGLAAKALFNVVLIKNFREAASKILIAAGLLIALFGSLDSGSLLGAVMQALPGLAIAAIGFLSRKFPRPIGVVIFIVTAVLLYIILDKGLTWAQIGTAVIVSVPLITAGACLFTRDKSEPEVEPKSAS